MAERIVKKVKIEVTDNGSLKKTSKDSQTLNRNMKGLSKQSSNSSKNFSKTAQGMQGVLVPAYAEVAARVFALTAVYQALSKAADFRILQQGQAEYAKRTGKNMGDIAKQVQLAAKGMLDFQSASSAVALATTSGISSSQIVKMTKAAVDSSTALGRSVTDTMDRLTRGIVKAEPEILDEIGVIIRLDAVYKKYAESVSKSTAELSEGEKATARYNAIMGQLEDKFGGIGDAVDPNYMRAAAASVLDILAQAGTKLVGFINPFMRFLTESKSVIIVILAVILKTLLGKIFPVFETMGARLRKIPVAMSIGVNKITMDLDKMKLAMFAARDASTNLGQAIDKSMKKSWQGKGFVGTNRQKLKSMGASIRMAEAKMGTGSSITSGKYAGMTRAQLNSLKKAYTDLRAEVLKTNSSFQTGMNKARVAIIKTRMAMSHVIRGFRLMAQSAAQYFSISKGLMAEKGLLQGTIASLKLVAAHWRAAGVAVGLYSKAIKGLTAVTAVLGVVAAATATAVNSIFAIVMWLTIIISLGKMLLNMFVDFDTPFKRAADAAKQLNTELKEQKTLFSQRDDIINFEGAATSFDEAMAQATFADNFATSLYESTSKAMKALSAEMGEMGFWEGAFDWIKDLFGMGSMDYQMKSIRNAISLTRSGPGGEDILSPMRKKYKVDGTSKRGENFDQEYIRWLQKQRPTNKEILSLKGLSDSFKTSGAIWTSVLKNNAGGEFSKSSFASSEAGKKSMIPRTLEDYFDSDEFKDLDDPAKTKRMLGIWTELNEAQKKAAETAKILRIDLTEMSTAFEAVSKAQKKFTDKLLVKTAAHDMAVQQTKLMKLFAKDGSVPAQTKLLALQKQGLLKGNDIEGSKSYAALETAQKSGTQVQIRDAAIAVYNEMGDSIDAILGGLEDWVAYDEILTHNVTKRLRIENELAMLDQYSSKTGGKARMWEQKQLANIEIELANKQLAMMRKENTAAEGSAGLYSKYSFAKIRQATQLVTNLEQKLLRSQTLNQNQYGIDNVTNNTKATVTGKYAAIRADLQANKPHGYDEAAIDMEEMYEYNVSANAFIATIGKSTHAIKANLAEIRTSLSHTGKLNSFLEVLRDNGYGKFMNLNSMSTSDLTELTGTSEGKSLINKMKATKLEITKLQIEKQYHGKSKALIEYRKKVAEIELKTSSVVIQNDEKRLALAVAIEKAQATLRTAQLEEDIGWLRDSIKSIADGFGNAIKNAANDIFMNKGFSMDNFRTTLAEGFASGAANTISGVAQKTVFGNKGLIANALQGTALAPFIDDLFPKTQLEIARDSLAELQKLNMNFTGQSLMGGAFATGKSGAGSGGSGVLWTAIKAMFGFANGGIAPGGYRAFANGGLVNKPTLGMIGEGKYNEAVVPLPDGKSIPVKGVGNNNVTVNVAVDSNGQAKATESSGSGAKELGYLISQAVQSELVDQQRPGGLLSAY
jgi:hypothetical protein